MKLEEIGFYTLDDERAKHASETSPLWRCELLLTNKCNFHCPYCRAFYDHTLPYYELEGVAKKPNLNYHRSKTMDLMSCLLCSAPAHQFIHGCYCIKHSKIKPMCLGICKHGRPCKNKAGHELYCKIHLKK